MALVLDVDRSSQLLGLLAIALLLGGQIVETANAIHQDRGQHVDGETAITEEHHFALGVQRANDLRGGGGGDG